MSEQLSKNEQQLAIHCVRSQLDRVDTVRVATAMLDNHEEVKALKEIAKKLKKLLRKMEKGLHLEN